MPEISENALKVTTSPAWRQPRRNPYNYLLNRALVRLGVQVDDYKGPSSVLRHHVWHIHWPDPALRAEGMISTYRAMRFLALMSLVKVLGTRIVWTVHNLTPHERGGRRFVDFLWKQFVARLDGVISLTASGVPELLERFPHLESKPIAVTRHGHYRDLYPTPTSREAARATLGIARDAKVFLYFGQIRPYKNVPELVRAFSKVDDPNARLIICGEPRKIDVESLQRECQTDQRVIPRLERIVEEEVADIFAAADLVVLPIKRPFNSGTLMLALSFSRPVLINWSPTVSEIRDLVGRGWIHTYTNNLNRDVLERAMAARADGRRETPDLREFEWEPIAYGTFQFYQEVLRSTESARRYGHGTQSPEKNR